ncbi:MAG: tetratricopeptide repeat protein [Pseudomonadota bacterium]|nr:tetratricopeptide repeat protein [Pseudomonadota bacterium]
MASSNSDAVGDGAVETLLANDAISPLDAAGLAELIALLAKSRRDKEASVYAARLLKLRPAHRRALRALSRSAPPDVDVIGGWRALAETAPEDVEPWLQIARLAVRAKDHAMTLQACEEILRRDPGNAEALTLSLAAMSSLNSHDDMGSFWRRLHEADPERGRACLSRFAGGGDIDAAATLLGEAGAIGALDAEGEHQRLKYRSRLTVGAYEAEVAGDDPAAARDFWRLTRLEPKELDHADGLKRALGRLRAKVGSSGEEPGAEMADAARTLSRFEPQNRDAWRVLGQSLSRSGAWSEAADALTQAVELGSDQVNGALLLDQAAACARCGRLAEAAEAWKQAGRLAEDDPEALARVELAREPLRGIAEAAFEVAFERGDWTRAWRSHEAFAQLGQDSHVSDERTARLVRATSKAMSLAADEKSAGAIDLAQLILAQAPNDGRARLVLGRALLRERRYEEALEVWRMLADDRPDSVEPRLQITRLAKRLGLPDIGLEAAEAVLSLDPTHEEARGLRSYFDQNAAMG